MPFKTQNMGEGDFKSIQAICHVSAAADVAATIMCKEPFSVTFSEDVWADRAAPGAEPEPYKLSELCFMDMIESKTHRDRRP